MSTIKKAHTQGIAFKIGNSPARGGMKLSEIEQKLNRKLLRSGRIKIIKIEKEAS